MAGKRMDCWLLLAFQKKKPFPASFSDSCLIYFSVLQCYGLNVSLSNSYVELGVVVNAYDSIGQEAEAGGWPLQNQLGLSSKVLS